MQEIGDVVEGMSYYGQMYSDTFTTNLQSWADGGQDWNQGALNWQQIYNMSSDDLGGYLSDEFGLGSKYVDMITPLNMKPFQAEYEAYSQGRDSLMAKTGDTIVDLERTTDTLQAKSGFAHSGQVEAIKDEQSGNIIDTYQDSLKTMGLESMRRITAEQDRQVERFYDDITALTSLDASGDNVSNTNVEVCFSGESLVELKSGMKIPMKYLKKGDVIKTSLKEDYSEVVAWLHKDSDEYTNYLEIATDCGERIVVSHSHVLFKNKTNNKEVFAGDLKVGDKLQNKKIVSIANIVEEGYYAPITLSGELLVDGFRCSSFALMTHKAAIKVWKFMIALKLEKIADILPSVFEKPIGRNNLFFFPWLALSICSPFTKTYKNIKPIQLIRKEA